MFASSGEATAPCGVPTSVFDHFPSSDTPALSHFWMRRSILRSAMRCSMNLPTHSCDRLSKEATNVGIEVPVHLLPIGEPQKILFINLVEDHHYGLLNDFIL